MNTTIESLQALYVKNGGSLTDTYSDICGGAAVGNYTTIPDMVAACAKLNIGGGGGGAEKFVVTLTEDDGTWTAADGVTVADIVAADAADKIVVCKVSPSGDGMPYELSLTTAVELAGGGYVSVFTGVIMGDNGNDSATIFGSYAESQTNWLVTTTPIPTSSNAPLIVTLTADQSTGDLVANKTYKEVYDAFNANTTVTIKGDLGEGPIAGNVLFVGLANGGYSVAVVFGGSIVEAEGAETDNVTITVGG